MSAITRPLQKRSKKFNHKNNTAMLNEKITFDKFIRWAIITLLVVTVLVAVNYLSEVLLPFFVAWLLAYLV